MEKKKVRPINEYPFDDFSTKEELDFKKAMMDLNLYTEEGKPIGAFAIRPVMFYIEEMYFAKSEKYQSRKRWPDTWKLANIIAKIAFWTELSMNSSNQKNRKSHGEFFKSYSEWYADVRATRGELDLVRKLLCDMGYLEVENRKALGTPTLHWVFNLRKFRRDLRKFEAIVAQAYTKNVINFDPKVCSIKHMEMFSNAGGNAPRDKSIYIYNYIESYIESSLPKGKEGSEETGPVPDPISPPAPSSTSGVSPASFQENGYDVKSGRSRPFPTSTSLSPPVSPAKRGIKLSDDEVMLLPVIEEWNSLPPLPDSPEYAGLKQLTRHKYDMSGRASKTVKAILEKLVLISKGKLLATYPEIKTISDVEIEEDWCAMEISLEMFKKIFRTYREYFDPGKGVMDKQSLPTTLTEFIGLNEVRTRNGKVLNHKSWFWEILHQGSYVPELVNLQKERQNLLHRHSNVVAHITAAVERSGNKVKSVNRLQDILTEQLLYFHELNRNKEHKSDNWVTYMSSFSGYMMEFCQFLQQRCHDGFHVGHFKVLGYWHTEFLAYYQAKCGIKLPI